MDKRFELRLTEEQLSSLRRIAVEEQRSVSNLIRVLINEKIRAWQGIAEQRNVVQSSSL